MKRQKNIRPKWIFYSATDIFGRKEMRKILFLFFFFNFYREQIKRYSSVAMASPIIQPFTSHSNWFLIEKVYDTIKIALILMLLPEIEILFFGSPIVIESQQQNRKAPGPDIESETRRKDKRSCTMQARVSEWDDDDDDDDKEAITTTKKHCKSGSNLNCIKPHRKKSITGRNGTTFFFYYILLNLFIAAR